MSAMLLYIITNAVLFSFVLTNENIPYALADWILAQNFGPIGVPAPGQRAAAARRQLHGAVLDHPDHGARFCSRQPSELGIDPVHFGIVIDVNMEVRAVPPAGWASTSTSHLAIARLGITELTEAVHALAGHHAACSCSS